MKKILSSIIVCAVVVSAIGLTACGNDVDTKFVGSWEATSVKVNETEVKLTDLPKGTEVSMSFEIKEDGTVKAITSVNGTKNNGSGKWTSEDDKITITDDSDVEMTGTYEDKKITMIYQGMTFILEKK